MKYNFKLKKVNVVFFALGLFLGVVLSCFIHAYIEISNSATTAGVKASDHLYEVEKVIDGDTIQVRVGRKSELVRLLGINTPEVENKYRRQECYGPEASVKTKQLLSGQQVYLLPDPQSPNRDKYGRWLRYVFLADGVFINAELIQQGYAWRYIYQPIQFGVYFAELEKQAREQQAGLWGPACDYFKKLRE